MGRAFPRRRFAAGAIPQFPLNLPLIKGAAIVGILWGSLANRAPARHQENVRELLDWYEGGLLRQHIDGRVGLADGIAAIRWLADRKVMGKVILQVA